VVRRRLALVVTVACVLLLAGGVVAGLATWHAAAHHASADPERLAALAAAHQVKLTVHGTFLLATYRPDAGQRGPSNTGHPCPHHTVEVRLIWKDDANFTHGGVPGGAPDGPRKALLVTADAASGVPCLIGASYSHVRPGPHEIYLFGPWKAGLGPR
jgi:hypothetical protein